jgi:hypothetical protein
MKPRLLLVWIVAAIATLVSGLLHGHFRNRWGGSESATAAVERLHRLPARLGEWETIQTSELSDAEQTILQPHGALRRIYRHQRTGEWMNLSIIVGPFGPTAAHTPEVCLGSSEFEVQSPRRTLSLEHGADEFWTVVFRTTDVEQRRLRVTYAWSFNGPWTAAQEARFRFAASPYLYKLSLSCNSPDDEASLESCRQFLESLLPELAPLIAAAPPPDDPS